MDKQEFVRIFLIVGVVILGLQSCRRVPQNVSEDPVVEELNRIKPTAARLGIADRVESVLSMRKNGVRDPEPFLVYGTLGDPQREPTMLALCIYDEDVDVLGLGVQEEYIAPDGSRTTLVEEYPVFAQRPATGEYDYRGLPVRIRNAGQRKDAALWDRYVTGDGIDTQRARNPEYYVETLPPVWISLPASNGVDVQIYLYDQAGNRSEAIRPLRTARTTGEGGVSP